MDLDASINLLVMSRLGRFIEYVSVGVVGQLRAEPGRDNRREASPVSQRGRMSACCAATQTSTMPRDPQHAADGKAVLQC
jgi:hypothetical protein